MPRNFERTPSAVIATQKVTTHCDVVVRGDFNCGFPDYGFTFCVLETSHHRASSIVRVYPCLVTT